MQICSYTYIYKFVCGELLVDSIFLLLDMDGRNLLLILLLELWHLENVSACTILVLLMLKLRQIRDHRIALDKPCY